MRQRLASPALLMRRALGRADAARRWRTKSTSRKEEDPFHNRATAMNFESTAESASWLQRLTGVGAEALDATTTEGADAPRAATTEFERYKAAAKAAVKTDAGLKSGDELLFAGEDGDWLRKLEGSSDKPRTPKITKTARTTRRLEAISKFDLTPRELKARLDTYVIGQEEAKKALSVALTDHFQQARRVLADPAAHLDEPYHKRNVLLLGPSGVGKTALLRAARLAVDAPLVTADATAFSATGYVGRDASDVAAQLVAAADGDKDLASFGVVCVDEVDKLRAREGGAGGDVHTRDVQSSLLKLIEDAEIDLDERGVGGAAPKRARLLNPDSTFDNLFSTKHVLFVFCGAFTDLVDKERVTPDDLVEAGLIRELVGRLAVRVRLDALNVDDLASILDVKGPASPLTQIKGEFAAYGVDVAFSDCAIRAWAERAYDERTGARGLATAIEDTLRGFKYELPGSGCDSLRVTAELVAEPGEALRRLLS